MRGKKMKGWGRGGMKSEEGQWRKGQRGGQYLLYVTSFYVHSGIILLYTVRNKGMWYPAILIFKSLNHGLGSCFSRNNESERHTKNVIEQMCSRKRNRQYTPDQQSLAFSALKKCLQAHRPYSAVSWQWQIKNLTGWDTGPQPREARVQ